jgi:hypothetical protein
MNTQLFDKTDKGREEISTRCHHLAPRMRTLLLLVDGKSTVDQVLKKVAGLGLDEAALIELLDQQFIHEAVTTNADEQAVFDAISATNQLHADSAAEVSDAPASISTDTQLQKLHQFFSATIKSTLGLRGFPLQLKADRATSLDDFIALREPYLAAVLKAAGQEMQRILADRLDLILQGKQ